MSRHRTLKNSTIGAGLRSVMTRAERLEALNKEGRWQEGKRVVGLPKTKVVVKA